MVTHSFGRNEKSISQCKWIRKNHRKREKVGEAFYSLSRSEDRNASVKTITTKTPKKQNLSSQTSASPLQHPSQGLAQCSSKLLFITWALVLLCVTYNVCLTTASLSLHLTKELQLDEAAVFQFASRCRQLTRFRKAWKYQVLCPYFKTLHGT